MPYLAPPESTGKLKSKPEELYKKTTDPAKRRALAAAVVKAYAPRIASMARQMLNSKQHWEEAEQEGVTGLLRALVDYDPEIAGEDRGNAFWGFAHYQVRDAIRDWIDVGIYWRKREREKDPSPAAQANAIHVLMEEPHPANVAGGPTPEDLLIDAERQWQATQLPLTETERAVLSSDDGRITRSRRHKILVARARELLGVKGGA